MSKLIQCNVPSTNIRKSRDFYSVVFGDIPFARTLTEELEGFHLPISVDGVQLTITPRQSEEEQITCYFAVDNLEQTLSALERTGGTVVCEPFALHVAPSVLPEYATSVKQYHPITGEIAGDIGRSAIVRDPDGNLIGLTELRDQSHWLFKYGKHRVPLDKAQHEQHKRGCDLGAKVPHRR